MKNVAQLREEEISSILEKLWHSYFQFLSNNTSYIKNSTVFSSVSSITTPGEGY